VFVAFNMTVPAASLLTVPLPMAITPLAVILPIPPNVKFLFVALMVASEVKINVPLSESMLVAAPSVMAPP